MTSIHELSKHLVTTLSGQLVCGSTVWAVSLLNSSGRPLELNINSRWSLPNWAPTSVMKLARLLWWSMHNTCSPLQRLFA